MLGVISSLDGRWDMISHFLPLLRFFEIKHGLINILDPERSSGTYVDRWEKGPFPFYSLAISMYM